MDANIENIFLDIESEFINVLKIIDVPNRPVYACAFHHFYLDGENIHDPYFAYNIESSKSRDPTIRWCPADWLVDVDGTFGISLGPLYASLSKAMKNESDEKWDELSDYQDTFYCNMCMKLNDSVNKLNSPLEKWNLTDDFVIGVFDWGRGDKMNELAKNSVGEFRMDNLRIFKDYPA